MPYTATSTEYVEINGVPLHTAAWMVEDLAPLWTGVALRGEDRLIPFSNGELALRRRIGALHVVVPLIVFGDKKWDGTTYSNARTGLWNNVRQLQTAVFTPSTSDASPTWSLILHAPDGSTWGAGCLVQWTVDSGNIGPSAVRGALDIWIPTGLLALLSS